VLLKVLRRRVQDRQLLDLVWTFLRAGVMEKKLFRDTSQGTPQGGIASPLLANIYLHELDRYMQRYTALSLQEKRRRRHAGHANFAYIRYADDWVVLCNGSRAEAEALKEELTTFLHMATPCGLWCAWPYPALFHTLCTRRYSYFKLNVWASKK
jgi:RNA-directed DNA polymerase